MSFFEVLCSNVFSMGLTAVFFVWASIVLFGEIPYKNRRHSVSILGSVLLYIFVIAFLGTVFFKAGLFYWEYNGGEIIIEYMQIAGCMIILRIAYQKPYKYCMAGAAFLDMLYQAGWNLQDLFSPDRFYYLEELVDRRLYLFGEWVLTPFWLFLVILVLYKTKAGELYEQWESQMPGRGVLIFMVLYPLLSQAVQEATGAFERDMGYNPMAAIIFLGIIYIIFMYAGREALQKKQIEEQRVSLSQQRIYIENLESLQREVRRFRHDFRNMMTGMYMQAREGDLEAIQNYIQEMTEDFDAQVGSQIRIMNQLANIRMAEVKGLFLEKLKKMQEENISCELEVFKPFEKTTLRSTDLCRCLGILLDNAMEEVRGQKDGQIYIIISSQNGYTTFGVKNTLHSEIDFHKIGTPGFSTKGIDRGIGLANYKRILDRYDRALPVTAIRDGYFIQELKIQEFSPRTAPSVQ